MHDDSKEQCLIIYASVRETWRLNATQDEEVSQGSLCTDAGGSVVWV